MKVLQIGCGAMGSVVYRKILPFSDGIDIIDFQFESKEDNVRIFRDFSSIRNDKYDVILICVKPQNFQDIAEELSLISDKNTNIISIMAGVSSDLMQKKIEKFQSITRVMPNLGMKDEKGINLIFYKNKNEFISNLINGVFGGNNLLIEVKSDSDIDKMTPVTGSGMAYFLLLGSIIQNYVVVNFNLDLETSKKIIDFLFDATIDMKNTNKNYKDLIQSISSKKGITEKVISTLDEKLFSLVENALNEGVKRSKEISSEVSRF